MVWQQIVLVVWFGFGSLAIIALIGKPRKPITPGSAIFTILWNLATAVLVVTI